MPGHLFLHDVSRDGRLLVHLGFESLFVRAKAPGETAEHPLNLVGAAPVAISMDGRQLLFQSYSQSTAGATLGPTRGGATVRLGEDSPLALSPDARWVLGIGPPGTCSRFVLTPTGAGEPRSIPSEGLQDVSAGWFADGDHVVFNGTRPGGRPRVRPRPPGGKVDSSDARGVLAVPGSLDVAASSRTRQTDRSPGTCSPAVTPGRSRLECPRTPSPYRRAGTGGSCS